MAAQTPKAPKPFAGSKPVKRTALAKATKTPMAKPKNTGKPASNSQIKKSETMLKNTKSSGNTAKDKAAIAKKTGVWPNGYTN
jgi:hypothetical protein